MATLELYDGEIRRSLQEILNIELEDPSWKQSSLPVRQGGLGIRMATDLALPTFLSSSFGATSGSEALLPAEVREGSYQEREDALIAWKEALNNNEEAKEMDLEYRMYDEEVEVLLISFIDDVFELIVTVVEDVSTKAYGKMMTTRQNLIKSVRAQVGSNLIVACSLLLSFLSVWIKMLKLSGMQAGKLQTSMKITMGLISTLERANERFARRQKENAKQFSKQRSKSMFR